MRQEKVILSFIMVLIGLLVAGVAFYFYQSEKHIKPNLQAVVSPAPSSISNKSNLILEVTNPKNEEVVSDKKLSVLGKTDPNATVFIITKSDQQVIKSSSTGNFNSTVTLDKDQNLITVISVLSNGDYKQIQSTVTYSTSSF